MNSVKNILCPVDFSQDSENSIKRAAFLAQLFNAELSLIHVITLVPNPYTMLYGIDFQVTDTDQIIESARKTLNELRQNHVPDAVTTKTQVMVGTLADELAKAVQQFESGLIVMSTSGSHGAEEFFIGSNAAKVVRTSPVPVLTINRPDHELSFRKILVSVGYGMGIISIKRFLYSHCLQFGSIIELVMISNEDPGTEKYNVIDRFLKLEVASLTKAGFINVTGKIIKGEIVSQAIIDHAVNNDFNMIAMNTHARAGISRFILGSITEEVINHSSIPVLSCKPTGKTDEDGYFFHPNTAF